MPLLRAQVILKHRSGLPRDHVVNTFHIKTTGVALAEAEPVAEAVRDFYVADTIAQEFAMNAYLGPSISNTGHEVRIYDIVEATGVSARFEGAPPLHTEVFDFIGRGIPAQGSPAEVSLCVSFKNTQSGATPPAQKRGRIYFGPIDSNVCVVEAVTGRVKPALAFMQDLVDAGTALVDRLQALPNPTHDLVVYSRPYAGREAIERPGRTTLPAIPARAGVAHVVDTVTVDDGFDTQRRRGERAVTRLVQTA